MKLLLVEDEIDLSEVIKKELVEEGYVVEQCYDGENAYNYLMLEEYDGAIMDVMLPKMSGFQVVEKIREQGIETPVLFLTARSQVGDIVKGLDIGADDYMVKPFEFRELHARIRVMTRKKVNVKENIYKCDDLTIDCNKRIVTRGEEIIDLSPREYAILLFMVRNKGIVLTREQIVSNIWDLERSGSSNVVDVYIRYLRKKIDDGYEHKFIKTIRGAGYILKSKE